MWGHHDPHRDPPGDTVGPYRGKVTLMGTWCPRGQEGGVAARANALSSALQKGCAAPMAPRGSCFNPVLVAVGLLPLCTGVCWGWGGFMLMGCWGLGLAVTSVQSLQCCWSCGSRIPSSLWNMGLR